MLLVIAVRCIIGGVVVVVYCWWCGCWWCGCCSVLLVVWLLVVWLL